jgi:alpha-1,6-mannosyltransferase
VKGRERLASMIASADALLHCSSAETYGFVVAETLSCGTPVVAPDTGGAADLAAPDCAETYPPGDVHAAAAALLRLLGRDRAELSHAALAAGRERIGDLEQHFDRLFALYAEAVRSKAAEAVAAGEPALLPAE